MSYKLIYTIPFKSRLNNSYQVNIEKENYTGDSTELQGAGSETFTVSIDEPDNDFRYSPTIGSTAKIKIIGSDYLQSLYSDNYLEYRVTLLKNNTVMWCGFIKPENYTQDYVNDKFELSIECLSGIEVLQNIEYIQQGSNGKIFLAFWDILQYLLTTLNCNYQAVYIPHVYADNAANYTIYDNVLAKMKVSEANFFNDLNNTTKIIDDEGNESTISDENPWKLQNILENMCRFLHWNCTDWNGSLYFVDSDWQGEYLKYTADLSSYTIVQFPTALNVQSVGFAGDEHKLDILPSYNKTTVKTSNYNAGDVFPTESFDDLATIETVDYSYKSNRCRKIFLQPTNFKPYLYTGFYPSEGAVPITDLTSIANRNSKAGAQLIKRAIYAIDSSGDPVEMGTSTKYTNYSYEDLIQVRYTKAVTEGELYPTIDDAMPIFTFSKKLPCVSYADGAISINMSTQLAREDLSDDILSFGDVIHKDDYGNYPTMTYTFLLKIGDYYYNGSKWTTQKSTFDVAVNNDNDNGGSLSQGSFIGLESNKTLSLPYNGLDGYIVPLPSSPLFGELKFKIEHVTFGEYVPTSFNFFIKDLKLSYQLEDNYNVDSGTDRVYENLTAAQEVDRLLLTGGVSLAGNISIGLDGTIFTIPVTTAYSTRVALATFIASQPFDGWIIDYTDGFGYLTFTNKKYGTRVTPTIDFGTTGATGEITVSVLGFGTTYINELDEIEEKISSYNYDGLCYSKVLLNDTYLTDNLYSVIDSGTIRPEEKLIERIINYYNATKIKLTQVLQKDDSITPISTFTDSYMTGKTFSMFCGNIDFQNDSFSVIMLEQ